MLLIGALTLVTIMVVMDYYCKDDNEELRTIAIKKNATML